jgi:hypothetical protein
VFPIDVHAMRAAYAPELGAGVAHAARILQPRLRAPDIGYAMLS